MFVFALLIGIYSYLIFFLGIFGWLYGWVVVGVTIAFAIVSYKVIKLSSYKVIKRVALYNFRHYNLITLCAFLLAFQAGVNLIGVLGPERGFDALWYHLTLPKLYLQNHFIDFVPGGLLYYSAMPKLGEMLFTGGLVFGGEVIPKFIQFSFGLLTCLAIYKLSRKFFTPLISLIAVVIFYSNLVVGWESTSAYIDLIRAFFEVMALWGFVEWTQKSPQPPLRKGGVRQDGGFILSAVMVGLAITTKLLAVGSLFIFVTLIVLGGIRGVRGTRWIRDVGMYVLIALAVPGPWFVFSYLHTGNPVYPFFTELYKVTPEVLSLGGFFRDVWMVFTQASDPLSLVYVVFFGVVVVSYKVIKLLSYKVWSLTSDILHPITIYSLLAVVVWYFTPRTGGGRFMLPYLPALSILCAALLHQMWKRTYVRTFLVLIIIAASLFSIGYRLAANSKYIPVIVGKETKQEFLAKHLNFAYGDFYDIDGYFGRTIKPTDRVLLYGFHNLYYVDFPFIDSSWLHQGDRFDYVAVQNGELPEMFVDWRLVYTNERTMVKLYRR